jgi:diadenosine tetraphosphate (Ap4A) HIT family hydrolase
MSPQAAPHATLVKFGYPASVVGDYDRWAVLLRTQQITLGSLVLVCKEAATAFPDVSADAFAELKSVTRDLERALAAAFAFDKINYLMLRMVDPHVHFHVLPRYASPRTFEGATFTDAAWPKPPDLTAALALDDHTRERLLETLRKKFEKR